MGLDPYDSELLGSDLKWMSGFMADTEAQRTTDNGEPKFPSVYVPDSYDVELRVVKECRYGYSEMTDTWYRVDDWEDLGDGEILATSKEEVPKEEVPQEWIDAVQGGVEP